jgi:hypothetical protein
MIEWKILQDTTLSVQRLLNKWKDDYIITIHGVTYDNNHSIIIVLTRKRISND